MHLFVIASNVPHKAHDRPGVTAVHIVLYELLDALRACGHKVTLQLLFSAEDKDHSAEALQEALPALTREGRMTVLPPIGPSAYLPAYRQSSAPKLVRLARRVLARATVDQFYPAYRARPLLAARVAAAAPDALVTVWSRAGVAATTGIGVPRIAYHGDLDYAPSEVRSKDRDLFRKRRGPREWLLAPLDRRDAERFKRVHFQVMRSLDVIANVTASNAKVYAGQGHPRSIYIPNTWTDQRPPVPVQQLPIPWPAQHGGPINIIGHVGFLDRTGTTYGLHYLLNQVMPELEPALRGLDYRVHVIGGGQPAPALQAKLAHPRVVVHGYVQDLDAMLWASDAFLFLNNAGPLRAAFTRHVIAWSMGLCLIVHANSRLAIPEIRHMENALAGATPAELAQLVRLAVTDRALNARLRTAGRATYEKRFTPAAVAQELSREAEQLVAQRRATQPASAGARR